MNLKQALLTLLALSYIIVFGGFICLAIYEKGLCDGINRLAKEKQLNVVCK